jgi:Ca2+-binding RTX toxin-like protein
MGMNTASVQRLYVAYFNRPADPVSLAVYEAMLPTDREATQAELQVIAETYFSPSAEYTTNFAGKSNSQIVDQLYQNIFGRTAEADGLISWAAKLANGTTTVAELALQLSFSAQGTDADVVNARIEAATSFTSGLDTATEITGYSGNDAAADGKTYLAQISGALPITTAEITAAKDAAIAGVDANILSAITPADAVVAGETTTLTTGADTVTGTAGNDNFIGLNTTLTTGDNINGGDGSDSLTVTTTLTNAAVSVTGFATTDVETAYVGIIDGSAGDDEVLTVDMLNSSPTSIVVTGSTATAAADGLVLSNVDSSSSVTMSATSNLDVTVNYDAAYLAGLGDTATVKMNGVGATVAADSDVTIGAGIETLTVNSSSTASKIGDLVWGGAGLTVTGDANLTIQDTLAVTANTIDASTFTGKLAVTTGNATDATNVGGVDVVDLTVTGGSGNDTLNVAAADAGVELLVNAGAGDDTVTIGADLAAASSTNAGDTLIGGDGTDTLSMTTALANGLTTAKTTGVSGFEILAINNAHTTSATLANALTGASAVTLSAGSNGGTLVLPDGANTLVIAAANAGALTVTDTLTGITDSLTISTTSLTTGVDMGANNAFTFTGVETVTIDTTTTGTVETDVSTITMTADTDGTTTLNVIGADTFHASGSITADVIDFSGMDAAPGTNTTANMGAVAVTVTSIKGSPGNDILVGDVKATIEGGAGNDTITGGSGNDTLHGDAGNDTITTAAGTDTVKGGAGNDTIVVAGNLSSLDAIDGGDGTDTLSATNASLVTMQALSISDANSFNASFNSVEGLLVSNTLDSTGDDFDLGYLAGVTTVTLAAGVDTTQTIDGFDSGDTLAISAALAGTSLTAKVNSSAAGSADVLNISLTEGADADYTTLIVSNVETINIDATEDTTGGNAASRTGTVGLTISQTTVAAGGSGAAQSVIITGSEDITIDTAVAAATIDASGLSARLATTPGLVMSTLATATTAMPGQTITGSSGADTLFGSTGGDTLTGGAGNDNFTASTGADTIAGGTGTDTFTGTTALTAASIEGTGSGTSTGVVVNLGATTLTGAAVLGTTTQNLSGSLTGVSTGQVAYLFNGELVTNSAAVKTLTSIENVTLADGINYVVGTAGANVINGGTGADTIDAGNGADTIDAGTGADSVTLTETTANQAVDALTQAAGDSVVASAKSAGMADTTAIAATDTLTFGNGVDTITGFNAGASGDTIDVGTAGAAITGIGVAENDLTASKTLFFSGAFVASTGVFTIDADGDGADTMIMDTTDAGDRDVLASDSVVILIGVDSDDLHADNFI